MSLPIGGTAGGAGGNALVLAGGIALGAFEAGAYAALHDEGVQPDWVAGSSIGAASAAILAGNPPERRVERLRQFWRAASEEAVPLASSWLSASALGTYWERQWRQAQNEQNALFTLLFGRPNLFRPRLTPGPLAGVQDVPALFDLAPLARTLTELVDFELLNAGPVRCTLCCTDVEAGDRVVFDTGRGDRIGVKHVLASCALLPLFAPVEIEGRLLTDGALSSNAPLDLVLREPGDGSCFVVDLFALPGQRPQTLAAGANRAADLTFGNQTRRMLEGWEREARLRQVIVALASHLTPQERADPGVAAMLAQNRADGRRVVTVAYRGGIEEAGVFKSFDFSRATLGDRWRAGEVAMRDALAPVAE